MPAPRRPATRLVRWLGAVIAVGVAALAVAGSAAAAPGRFMQVNLVSDQPGRAQITDPNLVNPWGLSAGPSTPLWVADNGTDVSTLYRGAVNGSPVSMVPAVFAIPGGAPTGTVFNPTDGFRIHIGGVETPAAFLFASESGMITAWAPTTPFQLSAVTVASSPTAIYKGLALGVTRSGEKRLYAADFHDNRVDVFNTRFRPVSTPGGFVDPDEPAGYAPFGIQAINDRLFVTYAKQDEDAMDEVDGPHLGVVDVYDFDGHLLRRFATGGPLNAPWGVVMTPRHWNGAGHAILIGDFGDGRINAYRRNGAFLGQLRDHDGEPITIDGLWGLRFGNGTFGTDRALTFAAGIDHESHGLLGQIVPAG